MDPLTFWILEGLFALVLILIGLYIRARSKWTIDRYTELNRAIELAHTRINNVNGHVQQVDDEHQATKRDVAVHNEKHNRSEADIKEIKGLIREIHSNVVPQKSTG